ncbi:hypothetical protein LJY25_18095 [Hymenobacter sp. BT175]|nr:hypothetical protein [Hymenobacter translucens]
MISLLAGCESRRFSAAAQAATAHKANSRQRYQKALTAAGLRPAKDTIAYGLRFGMDSVRVGAKLDSICRIIQPSLFDTTTQYPTLVGDSVERKTEAELAKIYVTRPCAVPAYLNGKLVALTFHFDLDNGDPTEIVTKYLLRQQLSKWYGNPGYSHTVGEMPAHNESGYTCQSWFQDGIEVMLSPGLGPRQGFGAILTYADVRLYPLWVEKEFEASLMHN